MLRMGLPLSTPTAKLRIIDFVVPFLGAYQPLWRGTWAGSRLRHVLIVIDHPPTCRPTIPLKVFRTVHAGPTYLWPIALAHTLGNGTDTGHVWFQINGLLRLLVVAAVVVWRLRSTHQILRRMIQTPRLLAAPDRAWPEHLDYFGALPDTTRELIARSSTPPGSPDAAAPAPTGRKMAAVAEQVRGGRQRRRRRTAQPQGRHLLRQAPATWCSTGLDAAAAASAPTPSTSTSHPDAATAVADALAERRAAGLDAHRVTVVQAPDRFVAGESPPPSGTSRGGPARRPTAPSSPRCRACATAPPWSTTSDAPNIALIAHYRNQYGSARPGRTDPGTMLVTLSGALAHGVVEIPTGLPLTGLISGPAPTPTLAAVRP